MFRGALRLLAIVAVASFSVRAESASLPGLELLMLDQPACEWCAQWDTEVGVVYHCTSEGRTAPLYRVSIHGPLPNDVHLDRPARYTPTFVLLREGVEIGRIEGYPGEAFFWGRLDGLIAAAGSDPQ